MGTIMCAMKIFKPYNPEQLFLLPPALRDWLPEGHLALFLSDVVDELDLGPVVSAYEEGDGRGQPPFHPTMMVKLLLYAYCTGQPSSRKIERASYEEIPYRVLAANQHPDHDSLAEFRKRHLKALAGLFQQVLKLCQAAGLVKLGHVALDGSKIKANASKHKAMSYERMNAAEQRLEQEVAQLLAKAQEVDAAEDRQYGPGRRGDELPAELAQRETRLEKIRQAKRALEQEAQARAEQQAEVARARIAERQRQEQQTGQKAKGPSPHVPDPEQAKPEPKAQRNFTDPDSRIMKDGATKSFEQAYNAQVVVDSQAQIVVAAAVTQQANDQQQLVPMLEQVEQNLGQKPEKGLADAGYFSEANVTHDQLSGIDLYVAPDREKPTESAPESPCSPSAEPTVREQMRQKLKTAQGQALYKMRKAIVEPVFGQIKQVRGFRRFSFRGREKVSAEWQLICLTHNLLKLFRAKRCLQGA
jgi:transposase